MKNSEGRPPRGKGRKVVTFQNDAGEIRQHRLAEIQQLQSEIAVLQNRFSEEWSKLRKELIRGIPVEQGPIRAFLKREGRKLLLFVK
jgi:hypothetical protein